MAGTRKIGVLTVDLVANTGGFQKGMSQAERQAEKTAQQVRRQQDSFQKLAGEIDPVVGELNRLDKMQARLDDHFKKGTIDVDTYEEYNRQIGEMRRQTADTQGVMGQFGNTARAQQAALRQLPMQFTDIFTSLQAGQPPMQVFLQQGGQLKDIFGGVGPMFREVGKYVASMINPFTVAAGAVGTFGFALYQSASRADELEKALALTNNALNASADDLEAMAGRLGDQAGNADAARKAILQMVNEGVTSMGEISRVAESVARRHEATGEEVEDLIGTYRDLGEDPLQTLLDLDEQYHFLTEATVRQIDKLIEQGDKQAAVKAAMEAWADASDEASNKVIENMNAVDRSLDGIATKFGQIWGAVSEFANNAVEANQGAHGQGGIQARMAYLERELSRPQFDPLGPIGDRNLTDGQRQAMETELAQLQRISEWGEVAQQVMGGVAKANSEAAQAVANLAKRGDELRDQVPDLQAKLDVLIEDRNKFMGQYNLTGDEVWLERMQAAEAKIAETRERMNRLTKEEREAQRAAEKAYKERIKAIEKEQKAYRDLIDTLQPAQAAQREYLKDQQTLNRAVSFGVITFGEYFDAIDRLDTRRARDITGGFMERIDTGGLMKDLEDTKSVTEELGLTFTSAFEDAIVEGKGLREVLQGIADDILRLTVRKTVTEPAVDAISETDWGDIGSTIAGFIGFGGAGGGGGSYSGGTVGSLYPGMSEGGYTGAGGKYDPAGLVHAGEFVVQKSVVDQPGMLEFLSKINRGYADGGYVGSSVPAIPTSKGPGVVVNVHTDGGSQVTRQESQGQGGTRQIDLYIERKVEGMFTSGKMDRHMRKFGARRQSA